MSDHVFYILIFIITCLMQVILIMTAVILFGVMFGGDSSES